MHRTRLPHPAEEAKKSMDLKEPVHGHAPHQTNSTCKTKKTFMLAK